MSTPATKPTAAGRDWSTAPLSELIDHILDRHHSFLRDHLPKIHERLERILGKKKGEELCGFIPELARTFFALEEELYAHLLKEEQILFPHIRRLEAARAAGEAAPAFHCGTVRGPIAQMEHEHASGRQALETMRRLTGGYETGDSACGNRRALFEDLQALERDLLEHMHLENDILHPRAIILETGQ